VDLNTEMGLILRNPQAAGAIKTFFETGLSSTAYEVRDADKGLVWVDRSEGAEVALPREPGLNLLHRAWLKVLSLAPIEHLL
jgi:hypothetical protein